MLSVKDIRVTFNPGTPIETRALRGLSLDIPTGQFVTVIGSNGAGKSTLLNVVSAKCVDSGRIDIDGVDVTQQPYKRAQRVARFSDPIRYLEDPTIEENMALAAGRHRRLASPSLRCDELRKLATLDWALKPTDRPHYLLSGGQRQAVSLLMATLQPSRILSASDARRARPRTADFVLNLTCRIVEESVDHHDGYP